MVPPAATLIPIYRILATVHVLNNPLALVLVNSAALLPFAVLVMRTFCFAIPRDTIEAAAIDGAGTLRVLWTIAVPMVRNGALVVGVITFVVAWGEFLAAITFINDPDLQPLTVLLAQQTTAFGIRYGDLTALAVLAALPMLLVYLLAHRGLRSGLTIGASR
jgi:ABC-type glycerol-3-phosphate transport system permease component